MKSFAAFAFAIASQVVIGQQSFFDSFDDQGLLNWGWYMECVSSIDYSVSNSMLHVTKMNYPICKETVWLVGRPNLFDTTQGFEMSVRVGWEDKPGRFTFKNALGSGGTVAYLDAGPGGVSAVIRERGGDIISSGSVSAPRSGFFTLKITRYGGLVKTYFESTLICEGVTNLVRDSEQLWIGFYAPNDQVQMGYHVDWAEGHPVPEPATIVVLVIGTASLAMRRKRASQRL
jgi:hypothetical protein